MYKTIYLILGFFALVIGLYINSLVNPPTTLTSPYSVLPNESKPLKENEDAPRSSFTGESWTLVVIDNSDKRTEISGYESSRECVEKGVQLSQNGEYFNCGHNCVYDISTVDGIRCKEYCGRGGCSVVPYTE